MRLVHDHTISRFFRVIHPRHREQNCFHLEAHGLLKLPCLALGQQRTKSLEADGVSRAGYRNRKMTQLWDTRLILLTNITVVRYQIIFIE